MLKITKEHKIGIVGSGIAGLTCAYMLDREGFHVTLLEKNDYLGGHTNTITINEGPDAGVRVDTGFIVYNDRNYPTFIRLMNKLGIEGRSSDMSFGFHREADGYAYSSYVPNGLFANRWNVFNPKFLGMVSDILKFNKLATKDLEEGDIGNQSLGNYLQEKRMGKEFMNCYLVPMGAAIWSTPPGEMLNFPAKTFLRFFSNHGLLGLSDRPHWRTIPRGSKTYIESMMRNYKGQSKAGVQIEKIGRNDDKVTLLMKEGETVEFDFVIIAAHADEAYNLLDRPTEDESRLLGVWKYTENDTVLHTDDSVMPKNQRAWASWNYTEERGVDREKTISLTYDMNRLQGLQTQNRYFVTLNRKKPIAEETVIRRIKYTHPSYTNESVATHSELQKLNGATRLFFCGSYFGYGFHEDAVTSSTEVLKHFGVSL